MEEKINIEDYRYEYESIDFSLRVRLRSWIVGFFGRRNMLKAFCQKNRVDYPIQTSKKYNLPEQYLVEHNEINRIAELRDKITLVMYKKYAKKQQQIDGLTKKKEDDLVHNKEVLEGDKVQLVKLKKKLATEKDPQEIISIESRVGTKEASIKNMKEKIKTDEDEIKSYEKMKKNNIGNWKKQVEIILKTEDTQNSSFIANITKKITKQLGYDDFAYKQLESGKDVKAIMGGEYNAE